MVDLVFFLIGAVVVVGGLFLALWATATRRQDARIAALERDARTHSNGLVGAHVRLEGLEGQLALEGPVESRIGRLEAFMRPSDGEIAPRLAQIEQQQAIDSRAFAHQARIHHRRIDDLDIRMQVMAREMVTTDALARTLPATPVDHTTPTPLRPPAP